VGWGDGRVSVKDLRTIPSIALLTVVLAIVIGLVFFVREQLEATGLPWPSALDTALSVLVGFVEPIMTPYDIRRLIALIAIFIIALGLLLRLGGPGAGR
jgi:ABC-type proline/glycine betaine transport system permease subunit